MVLPLVTLGVAKSVLKAAIDAGRAEVEVGNLSAEAMIRSNLASGAPMP
jgi:hypothetical protein